MSYQNWIDGNWVDAQNGETFESLNPADTSDSLGVFANSSAADINAAVEAADRAFDSWSRVPAPKRGELLYDVAEILKVKKEELSQLMTREMGKDLERDSRRCTRGHRYGLLHWCRRPSLSTAMSHPLNCPTSNAMQFGAPLAA